MTRYILPTCAALLISTAALAQEDFAVTHAYSGSFDDATFSVESAIIDRGLVIDHVSHTGEMLERTRADVGSDVVLFDNADIFLFCSADVSRRVMEADPALIAFCPYAIFVTDRDGTVEIGHRAFPDDSPMQAVEDLLAGIVASAMEQ